MQLSPLDSWLFEGTCKRGYRSRCNDPLGCAVFAPVVMVLLPLSKSVADAWALLMTEDKYLAIDSDHVAGLVSTMAIIGLTAMRDFPPAFPSDMDCRAAMFNGLSAEITESVNIDRSVVRLFLSRAYDAVLGADVAACSAPLATGAFHVKKRPLGGVWVEVDDPTSTPPHKVRALAMASGSPSLPSGLAALKGKKGGLLAAVAASVSEGGHGVEQCDFHIVEAVSMRSKHRASEAKAKRKVLSLLRLVGKDSLVFAEVLGSRSDVSEAEPNTATMLDLLCGKMDPKVVARYAKECTTYFQWVKGLNMEVASVGPVLLCNYLKHTLSRGKSVPTVVRCSLVWLESHAMVSLNASGNGVRDFVLSLARPMAGGPAPKPKDEAPPLPVVFVEAIEGLALTAPTLPLQVFAGVVLLCVHGVKRWADVQFVLETSHTDSGILMTTF